VAEAVVSVALAVLLVLVAVVQAVERVLLEVVQV
jgi:hypothetical protein